MDLSSLLNFDGLDSLEALDGIQESNEALSVKKGKKAKHESFVEIRQKTNDFSTSFLLLSGKNGFDFKIAFLSRF